MNDFRVICPFAGDEKLDGVTHSDEWVTI